MNFENPIIDFKDLPQTELIEFEPLPKRYLNYRRLTFSILLLVLSAMWIGPLIAGELIGVAISGGVWLAIALLIFLFEKKRYSQKGLALREHDITYKEGVFFQKTVTIPFNRIQHSETSRGPIERKFKLSTLKIFTAGGSQSDLSISGLDPDRAQELKDFIAKSVAKHV
ncbi:MAG: PH domain-containing protein [Flavobacteriales bacterium]|nr:PH domain-containing protein [Flavobacteriales bacterium]